MQIKQPAHTTLFQPTEGTYAELPPSTTDGSTGASDGSDMTTTDGGERDIHRGEGERKYASGALLPKMHPLPSQQPDPLTIFAAIGAKAATGAAGNGVSAGNNPMRRPMNGTPPQDTRSLLGGSGGGGRGGDRHSDDTFAVETIHQPPLRRRGLEVPRECCACCRTMETKTKLVLVGVFGGVLIFTLYCLACYANDSLTPLITLFPYFFIPLPIVFSGFVTPEERHNPSDPHNWIVTARFVAGFIGAAILYMPFILLHMESINYAAVAISETASLVAGVSLTLMLYWLRRE